jgi:MoaA/NifB/PqqE/SkfB family radical SAM enzyme
VSCPSTSLQDARWTLDFHARAARARLPVAATLELTRRCNLRCVHCYLGDQAAQHRLGDRELGTAAVKAAISEWVEAGCLYLTITGGEPMLRSDFAEIYRHARESGLVVTVFCNGTWVTDGIAELFRELPPRKVEISLYGATPATHDALTGVAGSHARAWEGIRRLQAAGVRVVLKTIAMTANRHEVEALARQAADIGADFRHDAAIFPCLDGGSRAPLALRLPPQEAVALDMADPGNRRRWREAIEAAAAAPDDGRLYPCSAGRTSFHADPFGGLSPCLMATAYACEDGNVPFQRRWEDDLSVILGRRATRPVESFRGALRGACTHCPAFNRIETGDEETESDHMNQTTRLRYEAAMGGPKEEYHA